MSSHIRLRRGSAVVPGESPLPSEPFWDLVKSRFGVFNNIDSSIEWYPRTYEDVLQLNSGQFLTGEDTSGDNNNVVLDWSTPNELIVRNKLTNTIIARFTSTGVYMLNPTLAATAEVGISNKVVNGNVAVKFKSDINQYPASTVGLLSGTMLAPNWMLWKGAGSSGNISVDFDENDAPVGTKRSFLINASGAPNKLGLRAYVHDYSLFRNRECVFFGSFKGPNDRTCMMRVSTAAGEVYSMEFGLSPTWQDRYFSVNLPDIDGQFIAIDFVYNPSRTDASLLTFRAAKFGMALGQTPPRYESRSVDMEAGLARGLFKEGSIYVSGANVGGIDLGLVAGTGVELMAKSSAGAVTLQDVNSLGAAANIAGATGSNRIDYRAAAVIRTAETN